MSTRHQKKRRRVSRTPEPVGPGPRLPLIAFVGRPNVGKSTLFNRVTGTRASLVEDTPGVTRDRKYGEAEWAGLRLRVVDTGGFEPEPDHQILKEMRRQTQLAIDEADVVVFIADARAGMNPGDKEVAEHLRRRSRPTLLAINKVEGPRQETEALEFHALGLGEVYCLSAEHGRGIGELLDAIVEALPEELRAAARAAAAEEAIREAEAEARYERERAEAEAAALAAEEAAAAPPRAKAYDLGEAEDAYAAADEGPGSDDDAAYDEGDGLDDEDDEGDETEGGEEAADEGPALEDHASLTDEERAFVFISGDDALAGDAYDAPPSNAIYGETEPAAEDEPAESAVDWSQLVPRIAVIGRPNAGKSTLINRLLGEERLLTFHEPGTTRDSVDTWLVRGERRHLLIDTAGVRRQRSIHDPLERMCVARSLDAIDRSDITWLLIDAEAGPAEQDAKVASFAHEKGRGLVLVLNKWDRIHGATASQRVRDELLRKLQFVSYAPVVTVSARTGSRVEKLLEVSDDVYLDHGRRISTGRLNRFFRDVLERHPPPTQGSRMVKLYFITQVAARPPTFMVSVNYPEAIHFSYRRYVVNQLRERFGFEGTPLRVVYRKRQRGKPRIARNRS